MDSSNPVVTIDKTIVVYLGKGAGGRDGRGVRMGGTEVKGDGE